MKYFSVEITAKNNKMIVHASNLQSHFCPFLSIDHKSDQN